MSDSPYPPQLQLPIPPTSTSFKRSFEQFGFDLDRSPVGASDTLEATEGSDGSAGSAERSERNKRARSASILSEGRGTGGGIALTSSSSSSQPGSSGRIANMDLVQPLPSTSATAGLGLDVASSPGSSLSHLTSSSLPPRLPTPEIATIDVDIEMLPPGTSNVPVEILSSATLSSPSSTPSTTASAAVPLPLPLSLSLPASLHTELGLDLELAQASEAAEDTARDVATAPNSSHGSSSWTGGLDRFAEIEVMRRVSPPLTQSPSNQAQSPPQLPPLQLNLGSIRNQHHQGTPSSGSSSSSSEGSPSADNHPSWSSGPPAFLDVPPTLFDPPFTGLDVHSDNSDESGSSSRSSIDNGRSPYTASNHPPMLPPIATTSSAIWEDETASPASASATVASSSVTAAQSIGDQTMLDLNLDVGPPLSPSLRDLRRWIDNADGGDGLGEQPSTSHSGGSDPVPGTGTGSGSGMMPYPPLDELSNIDAGGDFGSLARTFGLMDEGENAETDGASVLLHRDTQVEADPPADIATSARISAVTQAQADDADDALEDMLTQAIQGFVARGRRAAQTPSAQQVPSNPIGTPGGLDGLFATSLSSTAADPDSTRDGHGVSTDTRGFRHPLPQRPYRHQHRYSALRSSTSLVDESGSERRRLLDELDLQFPIQSRSLAATHSTSATASATQGPAPASGSTSAGVNPLDEIRRGFSRISRSLAEGPEFAGVRAQVNAAASMFDRGPYDDDWMMDEPPPLQDVDYESDDDLYSDLEDDDEVDMQMLQMEAAARDRRERLERLSNTMDIDPPIASRSGGGRLFTNLTRAREFRVGVQPPPVLSHGQRRPARPPLLSRTTRPVLPVPALPSPGLDMGFLQRLGYGELDTTATARPPPRPFGSAATTGVMQPSVQPSGSSTGRPYMTANSVPGSFPDALRRAYQDHGRQPSEGSLSQAMLGYAASGSAGVGSSSATASSTAVNRGLSSGTPLRSLRPTNVSGGFSMSAGAPSRHLSLSEWEASRMSTTPFSPYSATPPVPRPTEPAPGPAPDTRPSLSSMFTPGPYQNTLRMLESRSAASVSGLTPPVTQRPGQVSSFDLLSDVPQAGPPPSATNRRQAPIPSISFNPNRFQYRPPSPLTTDNFPSLVSRNSNQPYYMPPSLPGERPTRPLPSNPPSRLGAMDATRARMSNPDFFQPPDSSNDHPPPPTFHRRTGSGPSTGTTTNTNPPDEALVARMRRIEAEIQTLLRRPDMTRDDMRRQLLVTYGNDPFLFPILRGALSALDTNPGGVGSAVENNNAGTRGTRPRRLSDVTEIRRMMNMRGRGFNLGDFVPDDEFDDSYENLLTLAREERRRGTPEDTLAKLETGVYKDWEKPDSDKRCPICLDDYAPTDPVMKLNHCPHWMHQGCLQQWLKGATSCPVCRKSVLTVPGRNPGPPYTMRSQFTPWAPIRHMPDLPPHMPPHAGFAATAFPNPSTSSSGTGRPIRVLPARDPLLPPRFVPNRFASRVVVPPGYAPETSAPSSSTGSENPRVMSIRERLARRNDNPHSGNDNTTPRRPPGPGPSPGSGGVDPSSTPS